MHKENNYLLTILFLLTCLSPYTLRAQSPAIKLYGYVSDSTSGERLIGSLLRDSQTGEGTATNTYGYFSLQLPAGASTLTISHLGYQPLRLRLNLQGDSLVQLKLVQASRQLKEVEVSSTPPSRKPGQTQMLQLQAKEIQDIPVLMGEADVLKAFQLLPGVQRGKEGSGDMVVRGGSPDQNLIMLDGVPVYNTGHMLGLVSVFNPDAIKQVQLYKGGFPARFGGRLSSVMDIQLKEGNREEWTGQGSIGLLSSKILAEGPVFNKKGSILLSGRRTYLDLLSSLAQLIGGQDLTSYNFQDWTGKINYTFSDRDKLYLSLYTGRDKLLNNYSFDKPDYSSKEQFKLRWGNLTSSLRWNHLFRKNLFANFQLAYTNYDFLVKHSVENDYGEALQENTLTYSSHIRDLTVNATFDWFPAPQHAIKSGGSFTYHWFKPNALQYRMQQADTMVQNHAFNKNSIPAGEYFLFAEDEWKPASRLGLNLGMHFSGFQVQQQHYTSLQPRLSAVYELTENSALKASYVQMTQYIHLLSNSSSGMPTDIWVPSTNTIRPQQSWQAALGGSIQLHDFQLEIDGYYKQLEGVAEFRAGTDFLRKGPETNFFLESDQNWEERVETGTGEAYGAELLLRKKRGRLSGWLGYTLSWSNRTFKNINYGRPFPYRYDSRHNISLAGNYQLRDNIKLNFNWVFNSGRPVRLPVASYRPYIQDQTGIGGVSFWVIDYFGERNSYRMRDYHRLDLGVSFTKEKKWGRRAWIISVYNAYNRLNPYQASYSGGQQGHSRYLYEVTLFPVIPSISYRFELN
jgi:hypothetical protein